MSYHVPDYSALDGGPLEYSNGLHLPSYNEGINHGHEYSLLQSILVDGGTHFGVSTVSFDTFEELLWMGNQGGHMTSYATAELQKYTSFQVHVSNEVRQIVPHDAGILSLTSNNLRMSSRRGLPIFNHCSEQVQNMQCMVLTETGTLLMGGHHQNLIELDLNTIEEIQVVQVSGDNCAILRKHPRFICSGDISGKVTLHDPNSLEVEHIIECHDGMLSDFDVHGNQLVTCGFSTRHGELTVERFLKVYDLRMMKSMNPISMVFPPLLLRFVPAYSSRLSVVSQTGQFQMVDTENSDNYTFFIHQVETAGADILTFDTSSSCQAFAFGDGAGYLHLYGASNEVQFNQFHRPTEFADSVEPLPTMDINDEVIPLSIVPLPRCDGKLLSDLPPEFCQVAYRPTPPIDPLILNTMKVVRSIGYAPNPGNRRRNQVPYQLNDNKQLDSPVSKDDGAETVPQRYLKQEIKYTKMGLDDVDFNRFNRTSFSGLEANLPNSYCNNLIQIFYFIAPLRSSLLNHLCQREFCLACELGFLFHMLDTAQGLPCQAANFLRAFRTIPEASAHGLIVNDLNESKKRSSLPTLVQSWTRFMLQQLHTETLEVNDHILEDNSYENTSIMTQLFGAKLFSCNSCRCRSEACQETTTLLTQLLYPDNYTTDKSTAQYTFVDIVQRSLSVKHHITAWCDNCSRFTNMIQTKFLKSLPDILVLNCGENKQELEFWKSQLQLLDNTVDGSVMKTLPDVPLRKKPCRYGGLCKRTDCRYYHDHRSFEKSQDPSESSGSWIPQAIKLQLKQGEVSVKDLNDTTLNDEVNDSAETVIYELTGVVSVITDLQDNGRDNIVSCIKVGPTSHVRHKGSAVQQWYLFNDFSIMPISAQEAVYLNFEWKVPCVLYFTRKDLNSHHNLEVSNPVEKQVFRDDVSLAARSGQTHMTFTPLSLEGLDPPAGQLVAMDAEFVTLNQEEAEIRSDGTRSTIRPSQMSVARISCVRGDGPLEGIPFIDDYISTQEQPSLQGGGPTSVAITLNAAEYTLFSTLLGQVSAMASTHVVDYLTKFSGIQPGDLDASISSKHLTTLKATYQKLRYLIDTGVTFVGHGLKNDFRVINLVVPPAQVLDTVYLFQLPNKRMVSLRFLAWHFLDLKIQRGMHDSIEDAKTALQLYKKYLELEQNGKFKEALKELYDVGRQLQWKVPGIDD